MDSPLYRALLADLQPDTYNEISLNSHHARGRTSASPYANKARVFSRGNELWSTPCPHKTPLKFLFAALASVTAIIYLILVCRSVRSRTHPWISTRKLSSDGDLSNSGSGSLVVCEDSGDEASEGFDPQTTQAPLELPKAKKAKVERGGGLRGAQSVVEEESMSESDDEKPSTNAGRKRKRKAGTTLPKIPTAEGPESPARSEVELEAANALLSLHEKLAARDGASLEESTGASLPSDAPSHDTTRDSPASAGTSHISGDALIHMLLQPVKISLPSLTALVPTGASAPMPAATVGAKGTEVPPLSASTSAFSEEQQSSTSSAEEASPIPSGPRTHPYYRVPTVDSKLLEVRRFIPEQATSYGLAFTNLRSQLRRLRELLVKETLDPTQLDEVAQRVTNILSCMYHYDRVPTEAESPSIATRSLGRRFLALDAVVASLNLLGESACGPWWEQIMDVIPEDTREYATTSTRPASLFHKNLLEKLNRALHILKTGKRLSEEETIEIKRALFLSPYKPANFKDPQWDPWREDDKNFAGSS